MKHLGYGLLITGGITQALEVMSQTEAQTKNIPYGQTSFGSIVAPLENVLPFSLGWTLIVVGAGLVWLLPLVKKG